MSTLLERAQQHKRTPAFDAPSDEELELVMAFFEGRITCHQLAAALGKAAHVSAVYRAASLLRRGVIAGRVTIVRTVG